MRNIFLRQISLTSLFLIFILSSFIVNGQISTDITSIKCGDGVLDEYNMCEKDVDNMSRCDKMGEILKIDTGCWQETCACAPKVNPAFCGNDRREGVEMCDGTGEDFCEEYGEAIGFELKCIPDQCICEIVGEIPSEYNPIQEEEKESEGMAVCGDRKLHSSEECDPPNTLCNLEDDTVGVCAKGCVCVAKESIGIEEKQTAENETQQIQEETEEQETETEQQENEITDEEKTESEITSTEDGFFSKLWDWFKTIF